MKSNARKFKRQSEIDDKQSRVSQTEIPRYTLEEALRVPRAIVDNYAGAPTIPLNVAKAMQLSPTSSHFKMLCGASIAYGLTTGGYNASEIKIEQLAKRILRPTAEGDDVIAQREAFLKPRVTGEFLRRYDRASLPRDDIAKNVLVEMGVPAERVSDVLNQILATAEDLRFISTIKDKKYIDLSSVKPTEIVRETEEKSSFPDSLNGLPAVAPDDSSSDFASSNLSGKIQDPGRKRRVFITHGKNQSFIDPIKKLLTFGELDAVVSVERQTVSQPLPDKVMGEMRSCGAAIIHVDAEQKMMDQDAKEHVVLNPNVLIEIGAAMALYGRRFILLVRDGVTLPSNLQGLYQVRYTGDTLDGAATIKLLEAINEMKKQPLMS